MTSYSLVTLDTPQGPRAGIKVGDRIHFADEATGNPAYRSTLAILRDWDAAHPALQRAADRPAGTPVANAKLLAPLPDPGAVICTGSNYKCHSDAMERAAGMEPQPSPKELGLKPFCFLKVGRCVVGPGSAVPFTGERMDWEAELVAVIGRTARNVRVEDALSHVAGYMIGNDLSARSRFFRPQEVEDTPFRFNWFNHKCFDGSCPTGPELVPADYVENPHGLGIRLWVNDVLRQDSTTGNMIFDIAEQIAEYSSRITLEPGDIIMTGTPAGTGAESGAFLQPGDRVRIEIDGLGTLTHAIA